MKILLIQFAGRGGSQLYSSQLANALSESNDVTVLLAEHLMNEDYYIKKVKSVCVYAPPSHIKMLLLSLNPKTYYNIIKIIKKVNPDVIHATQEFLWVGVILPFINRYPFVITEHDPSFHKGAEIDLKLYIGFNRFFTRKIADAIIVHGKKLKKILIDNGVPENKIWVIPHGDFSFYAKWRKEEVGESKSVLFFGSISEYKGIEYLIKAEPLMTSNIPDLRIIIAGEGDFSKYAPLIKNKDNFEIHNRFIPNEQVAEFFQRASVVVLPYIDGSQTGIIPIAYSFKKPVVVTDVGSIPEVVDDGKTGYIVPPRNPGALAKVIVRLLKDDELRRKMGENAYKKMKEELSWDKIAENTVSIYNEVINEHNSKRRLK
jgi:glycosyltransferase involved in cell wall biosynthesis